MKRGTDRLLVLMTGGVGLIVLAGLIALFVVNSRQEVQLSQDSPEWVVQQYLKALEGGNWEEAYGFLADSVKDTNTRRSYETRMPAHIEQSRRILLEKSEVTDGQARVVVSISTFQSTGPMSTSEYTQRFDFRLKLEGGQWKIISPTYPPFFGLLPVEPRPVSAASPSQQAVLPVANYGS